MITNDCVRFPICPRDRSFYAWPSVRFCFLPRDRHLFASRLCSGFVTDSGDRLHVTSMISHFRFQLPYFCNETYYSHSLQLQPPECLFVLVEHSVFGIRAIVHHLSIIQRDHFLFWVFLILSCSASNFVADEACSSSSVFFHLVPIFLNRSPSFKWFAGVVSTFNINYLHGLSALVTETKRCSTPTPKHSCRSKPLGRDCTSAVILVLEL